MAVPETKIYNDAPDEFAEFIDSRRHEVSLNDLGGENNPFIKEGIYKESWNAGEELYYCTEYAYCPDCGNKVGFYHDFSKKAYIDVECSCGRELTFRLKDCTHFAIDHCALAEFMSRGLGCKICRQFKKTGWQFGKLRGYDVYFACIPTAGMYRALESAPKSVLVIGQNNPETLPSSLATRVIYLSRLLFVKEGSLHFANEVVEEKIPLPRGRAAQVAEEGKKPAKKKRRPPVQVYTPYYLSMMGVWLDKLQHEGKTGQPSKEWISDWLKKNCPPLNNRHLSGRQIYRHIEKLTDDTRPASGKPDYRSDVFTAHWNGCLDMAYVNRFSAEDLTDAIMSAFAVMKDLGYKPTTMRGMDAADFADKSDGKFGQKRNYRTHED